MADSDSANRKNSASAALGWPRILLFLAVASSVLFWKPLEFNYTFLFAIPALLLQVLAALIGMIDLVFAIAQRRSGEIHDAALGWRMAWSVLLMINVAAWPFL